MNSIKAAAQGISRDCQPIGDRILAAKAEFEAALAVQVAVTGS
jgi:hypothetical protein